jgi:NitT/TauT family transport system substrate-binding protein
MTETPTVPLPDKHQPTPFGRIRAIFILSVCLIAGGALFVLAGIYGTTLETSTSLRVGTNLWIGYQPLRIAQTSGELPDGISILEGRSTSSIMEALKIGTVDAATLTLDEAVRVASNGVPITVMLVLDISDGADIVIARSESIANAGPRGKRIGVEAGAVGALVLFRWLTLSGLQVSDVTIVDIAPPDHPRAFTELDVDFLVTYEPIASKSLPSTAVLMFDSSQIPGDVVDVLVVRRDRLRAQLTNVRKLKNSWFFGIGEIANRTPRALSQLSRHQDLAFDDIELILRKLRFPSEQENAEIFRRGRLKDAADRIDAWLSSAGVRSDYAHNLSFSDVLVRNH